jgi:hypothetical protein
MLGILDIWKAAWTLHQDGFHEMILSSELVEFYSKKVKEVKFAKKVSSNL